MAPISPNLSADQLFVIASDTKNLDDDLLEQIKYHPSSYLALSEWATAALVAGVTNIPTPPPPEPVDTSDARANAPRKPRVKARAVVLITAVAAVGLAGTFAWKGATAPATPVTPEIAKAAEAQSQAPLHTQSQDAAPKGHPQIAGNQSYQCETQGTGVTCWGWISDEEIHDQITIQGLEAQQIGQLAVGHGFAAAVTTDGTIYTWGINDKGQLGTAPGDPSWQAKQIGKLPGPATSLIAGVEHACALSDTQVFCFGSNRVGQIRGLATPEGLGLTLITDIPDVESIGTSGYTTWALTKSGVYAWGNNKFGQVDPLDPAPTLPPTQLGVGG